jgi:methylmalonyl-CoA mutase N-terminal domain/subunit
MTDAIEREAEALLKRIQATGGTLAAIECGFIQREIQESAYQAQVAIDSGKATVVGVNKFTKKEPGGFSRPLFSIDPEVERRQVARVRELRGSRDARAHAEAIAGVSRAANDGTNVVPSVVAAVEARATLGEIADAMRVAFGEYRETATI